MLMQTNSIVSIDFWPDPEAMQDFFPLLRQGFYQKIRLGTALEKILHHDLEIPEDYVRNRLQTLFLDHQPVDDLKLGVNTDWSTLSLSAAMPGLVGACFRRQGVYSGLRKAISYDLSGGVGRKTKTGMLKVKLYNFPAKELGPRLFKKGVIVFCKDFLEFVGSEMFEKAIKGFSLVHIEAARVAPDPRAIMAGLAEAEWVRVRVGPRSDS